MAFPKKEEKHRIVWLLESKEIAENMKRADPEKSGYSSQN
jgi:hypothetical protein